MKMSEDTKSTLVLYLRGTELVIVCHENNKVLESQISIGVFVCDHLPQFLPLFSTLSSRQIFDAYRLALCCQGLTSRL